MFAQYAQEGTFDKAVKMAEDVTDLAKRCAAAARANPDCLKPLVSTFMLLTWQTFSEVTRHFRALLCIFPKRHEYISKRLDFLVYARLALLALSFSELPSIKHLKISGGEHSPSLPPTPNITASFQILDLYLSKRCSESCAFTADVTKFRRSQIRRF